jgi:hypothetical protein
LERAAETANFEKKKDAITRFRKNLDGICRFAKSGEKAETAVRDALVGADLAAELADTEEDALVGGHLDLAGWLAGAKKINALAKRFEDALAKRLEEEPNVAKTSRRRPGPVPLGPRNRLIGEALPGLYAKVFGGKFYPTRTPDIEFVQTCLALLGETPAGGEFVRDCVKLAGKRRRERSREGVSSAKRV